MLYAKDFVVHTTCPGGVAAAKQLGRRETEDPSSKLQPR